MQIPFEKAIGTANKVAFNAQLLLNKPFEQDKSSSCIDKKSSWLSLLI